MATGFELLEETLWVLLPGDKECARESLAQFIREDVRRR